MIFVGFEEKDTHTYISRCESYIEDNYKHAFLTNGGVIKKKSNYNLNRINLEIEWSIPLIRMQLSGLMDVFYIRKSKLVSKILNNTKI